MNREQIINQLTADKEYRAICRQIARDYADDLYQELMLFILEIPEDKLSRLNETCLKCFFYRMAQKQYCSNNSAFYKKYRKDAQVVREHAADILVVAQDIEIDQGALDEVIAAMRGLYWYDKGIIELYAEKGSMRTVSQETGIPLQSIHGTVASARKQIKKKIKAHA